MIVLALGSHFDDIEFGLGGSLIKHRDAGDTIWLAITHSDDALGGDVEARGKEQQESIEILGAENFIPFLQKTPIEDKVGILDSLHADILYFPMETDYHQHHKETSTIGFAVARNRHMTVLKYINQSSHSCYPNYLSVIDIEEKKKLVSVFKSQNGRQPKFIEIMEAQNRYFGSLVSGSGLYAEGFVLHRMVKF